MLLLIVSHVISIVKIEDLGDLGICDLWGIPEEVGPFKVEAISGEPFLYV